MDQQSAIEEIKKDGRKETLYFDSQEIQEAERFIRDYPDKESKKNNVSEVVDKVNDRTDEARRNDELGKKDERCMCKR